MRRRDGAGAFGVQPEAGRACQVCGEASRPSGRGRRCASLDPSPHTWLEAMTRGCWASPHAETASRLGAGMPRPVPPRPRTQQSAPTSVARSPPERISKSEPQPGPILASTLGPFCQRATARFPCSMPDCQVAPLHRRMWYRFSPASKLLGRDRQCAAGPSFDAGCARPTPCSSVAKTPARVQVFPGRGLTTTPYIPEWASRWRRVQCLPGRGLTTTVAQAWSWRSQSHASSRGGLRTSLQERARPTCHPSWTGSSWRSPGMAMGSGVTRSFPQAGQCGGQVTSLVDLGLLSRSISSPKSRVSRHERNARWHGSVPSSALPEWCSTSDNESAA
jgi:hypothetical protein